MLNSNLNPTLHILQTSSNFVNRCHMTQDK